MYENIEGALSDEYGGNSTTRDTIYNANITLLNILYGSYSIETGRGCNDTGSGVTCGGAGYTNPYVDLSGSVDIADSYAHCGVDSNGGAICYEDD